MAFSRAPRRKLPRHFAWGFDGRKLLKQLKREQKKIALFKGGSFQGKRTAAPTHTHTHPRPTPDAERDRERESWSRSALHCPSLGLVVRGGAAPAGYKHSSIGKNQLCFFFGSSSRAGNARQREGLWRGPQAAWTRAPGHLDQSRKAAASLPRDLGLDPR